MNPDAFVAPLPTEPRGDYSRLTLYIFGAYLLLATLIAWGTHTLIQQDRLRQQHAQDMQLASLTRVLQEYVSRTLDETSSALKTLRLEANAQTGQSIEAQTHALQDAADQAVERYPYLVALAVFPHESGQAVVARQSGFAQLTLPRKPAGFAIDRQHAVQILHPIQTASGKRLLPVYERWNAQRNERWQEALALIDLDSLGAFAQDIRLTGQDRVHLLDDELHTLVNFPLPAQGQADQALLLAGEVLPSLNNTALVHCTYENQPSIGRFDLLKNYPLIVGASRNQAQAVAEFIEMRWRLLWSAGALLGVLAALSLWIHFDIRRRESARRMLREINTSLEARVQRRTAELEQSNRELMAFSYSVSHDLRAPLRAINGFAHVLKEDNWQQLDPLGQNYLDRIYRASVRMGELIDELLNLANVSRAPLKYQTVDLAEMAREIADELQMGSPERVVEFHIPEHLVTEGDETLLRNALSNLLHNAWKFTHTRNPAIISLRAEEDVDVTRYTVEDNGVGFDMMYAKRLFQPFQQLHANQGYGGTGIGLASVRRIIERHNGQISAEAAPEAGARFTFEIPRPARVLRRRVRATAEPAQNL